LLTALATTLACSQLHPHHATFPWDSLQLLQAMASSPPQPCQHHHQPPFCPDTLLQHTPPQQAARTALRILQHLFHTLSSPSTPHHWHAHARHHLLNNLQYHIHQFQKCMPANSMLFEDQGPHNLLLSINKYFGCIQDFIHTHHHSSCAWDRVSLKACTCFQHLHNFTRIMC
ncbi:IFN protein, partial [Chordeiles acutipennis]|nr:IFN protein [Chordeiles acutipennis]